MGCSVPTAFLQEMVLEQVLLVTGGSCGIGAATALLAAGAGYAVAVNYVGREDAAREVVRRIGAGGGRAIAVQGDAASEADVLRLFAEVDARLGRLTGLVNNAGVVDLAHQVPMGPGGTAEEVAQAIVWLLSPQASYTTMSMLDVSGGR